MAVLAVGGSLFPDCSAETVLRAAGELRAAGDGAVSRGLEFRGNGPNQGVEVEDVPDLNQVCHVMHWACLLPTAAAGSAAAPSAILAEQAWKRNIPTTAVTLWAGLSSSWAGGFVFLTCSPRTVLAVQVTHGTWGAREL